MLRNRIQSLGRTLGLAACLAALGCSGGGSGGSTFQIEAVNVSDGSVWRINRPIRITFNEPVDISSVNLNTINIRRVGGSPTSGTFFLTSPRTVVFQPRCPTLDDLSDAGLKVGGVEYEIKVLGVDKTSALTVRSTGGTALSTSDVRSFKTPTSTDPGQLYFDTVPGPPAPVLRSNLPGDTTEAATYLEVGSPSGSRYYFERDPVSGVITLDPPLDVPLNKLSETARQVSMVVELNQAVDPTSDNISPQRLRLEYQTSSGGWKALNAKVVLESNCTQTGSRVRIQPLGLLPPATNLRTVITAEFTDIAGDDNLLVQDSFARAVIQAAPSPLVDNYLEEFANGTNDDADAPFAEPHAKWEAGKLEAAFSFTGNGGPGGDFDWKVGAGSTFLFNTTTQTITGGANFNQITQQTVVGGTLNVRNLLIEDGAILKVEGPNRFKIQASGFVQIDGVVIVQGTNSPGVNSLNTTNIPEPGAPGQCGGGAGGTGSPLTTTSSPRGSSGQGAFGRADAGGQGGETGWSNTAILNTRRGAGGGGGRFGENVLLAGATLPDEWDQAWIGNDGEAGYDNLAAANGAVNGIGPARGGAWGPSPFTDPNPDNDFYGTMLDVANGRLITGELLTPWAGAGGGGGGDAARVPNGQSFPQSPFNPNGDEKGSGGGGGGGSIEILALGPIVFGPIGRINARGGVGGGGENTLFLNRVGGGGGGGSGGHVVLQSADRIDFSANTSVGSATVPPFANILATGGQGGAGAGDKGGAQRLPTGMKETPKHQDACPEATTTQPGNPSDWQSCRGHVDGAGGDGGPGIVQLHTVNGVVGTDPSTADIVLPPQLTMRELSQPPPLCDTGAAGASGCYMLPTFGRTSRARSNWIPLGEGGFDPGSSSFKDVTFEFAGTDPGTGLVQVDANGKVLGLPPLIGPALLVASPGLPSIDPDGYTVRMDASSLVGGANEYYLDDPELLDRFIIQLTDAGNAANFVRFDVASASYDSGTSVLTLHADPSGPNLLTSAPALSSNVELQPAFFRMRTDGVVDSLPLSTSVEIQFEATTADTAGNPNAAAATGMTPDITTLNAPPNGDLRFIRFQVLFDIGTPLTPNNPIPALEFFRVPFRY